MSDSFQEELESLINQHSIENDSDTPDFILAQYIVDCLRVYAKTVKARDKWYGFEGLSQRYGEKESHIDPDPINYDINNGEIPDASYPAGLWHIQRSPGVALCNDDVPNQGITDDPLRVTCAACLFFIKTGLGKRLVLWD